MIIAADDGNHKTLLQKVEDEFADMEHRMMSKKESSGSKDLDPLAADDGNHKTLLQKVEDEFADMEHRMMSKKESSGSKDLDPLAADDGNHKTLLQKVENEFADMEHRMMSKKESSGSKDLDPLLDPLDNLRPAAGTGDTCNSNSRTEEEHHGRLPGKVKGNEYSSSAANPAGLQSFSLELMSKIERIFWHSFFWFPSSELVGALRTKTLNPT